MTASRSPNETTPSGRRAGATFLLGLGAAALLSSGGCASPSATAPRKTIATSQPANIDGDVTQAGLLNLAAALKLIARLEAEVALLKQAQQSQQSGVGNVSLQYAGGILGFGGFLWLTWSYLNRRIDRDEAQDERAEWAKVAGRLADLTEHLIRIVGDEAESSPPTP